MAFDGVPIGISDDLTEFSGFGRGVDLLVDGVAYRSCYMDHFLNTDLGMFV